MERLDLGMNEHVTETNQFDYAWDFIFQETVSRWIVDIICGYTHTSVIYILQRVICM